MYGLSISEILFQVVYFFGSRTTIVLQWEDTFISVKLMQGNLSRLLT